MIIECGGMQSSDLRGAMPSPVTGLFYGTDDEWHR